MDSQGAGLNSQNPRPLSDSGPVRSESGVPLSPEEERVLERARDESRRISREELPAMFEKDKFPPRHTVGGQAPGTQIPISDFQIPSSDLGSRNLLLDFLGLCGVLLLIALLVAILLRLST